MEKPGRTESDKSLSYKARKIRSALKWQSNNRKQYLAAKRAAYRARMNNPIELEKIRQYARDRKRQRILNEPEYALKCRLMCRMTRALKNVAKARRTQELCGCSYTELRMRIEAMFSSGMSWENWNKSKNGWHLDHRVPCKFFDLENPEHQKRCFHYSNLRPLWGIDNLRKGSKLEYA